MAHGATRLRSCWCRECHSERRAGSREQRAIQAGECVGGTGEMERKRYRQRERRRTLTDEQAVGMWDREQDVLPPTHPPGLQYGP